MTKPRPNRPVCWLMIFSFRTLAVASVPGFVITIASSTCCLAKEGSATWSLVSARCTGHTRGHPCVASIWRRPGALTAPLPSMVLRNENPRSPSSTLSGEANRLILVSSMDPVEPSGSRNRVPRTQDIRGLVLLSTRNPLESKRWRIQRPVRQFW